jgi:glycosyltransferase involved in cell wall biosynthesis
MNAHRRSAIAAQRDAGYRRAEDPMVKVLVVGHTPPPYLGLSIMLDYLVRSPMRGVDLRHVRMELSTDESQVGKFRWKKAFRLLPIICRIIYARIVHRPDILYYAPAGPSRMGMLRDIVILGSTRFLFPSTILHFHSGGHGDLYDRLPRWLRWFFRRAFFHPDGAIRLTELTPEDGKQLKARREYIVPNGIADPGADLPLPRSAPVFSQARPIRILFVALLCEGKGLLVLIEACGKLAARGVPFELNLMGRFESDAFEARVRRRIAELRIDEQVSFLGVLNGAQKFAAFQRADLLCHPTFYDTFGLVLLEAMACGLPVVATRWCSIPLIVDDGQTGLLVEPHDPCDLADRLAELADNPRLCERMGIAARRKFLRDFTLPGHIERMRKVFFDVAGKGAAAEQGELAEVLVGDSEVPTTA